MEFNTQIIESGMTTSYRASSLRNFIKPREIFDPTNKQHVKEYALFLKMQQWKNNCPFFLEDPYTDIPTTINAKLAMHFLRKFVDDVKV